MAENTASPDVQQGGEKKEEECAWCKYMKGGPCKTVFEAWQACVDNVMPDSSDESRQAAVSNCETVTRPLFECMMRNPEYYGPQLAGMVPDREKEDGASNTASSSSSSRGDASKEEGAPATAPAAAGAGAAAAPPPQAAAAAGPSGRALGQPGPTLHAAAAATPAEGRR